MTESKKSGWLKILAVALMLSILIWVSGCTKIVKVKPDGALTVAIQKEVRDELDTPRTMLIKFERNNQAIDDANARFKAIRE